MGSCEADFHLYAESARYNEKKISDRRTRVFADVIDVRFSSLPFKFFAWKFNFVSLARKTTEKQTQTVLGFRVIHNFQSRGPNCCFDRRALVTLQLHVSVFCDTAYHAAHS